MADAKLCYNRRSKIDPLCGGVLRRVGSILDEETNHVGSLCRETRRYAVSDFGSLQRQRWVYCSGEVQQHRQPLSH